MRGEYRVLGREVYRGQVPFLTAASEEIANAVAILLNNAVLIEGDVAPDQIQRIREIIW